MSISYNKLWKLLIDKRINKTELRKLAGISTNVIAKLGKDEPVSMESMTKICAALNCDIGDIMEVSAVKEGSSS
ncbi:MAG: helix-turn-helix transcriptional regulator [Defluviitaleaceae bacterium]|nr:helix-turn-helix transcriptional regulator [Defluviitaleaceae bacterium]